MTNLNRRKFLQYSGVTAAGLGTYLLARPVQAATGCGAGEPPQPCIVRDGYLVAPSVGCLLFSHYHELLIPLAAIQNPVAEGLRLRTNKVYGHSHQVWLSYENLVAIKNREIVVVQDSLSIEHEFTIQLPNQLDFVYNV